MKGSEFISLMRKVIREEVRAIVKEELKSFKPVIVESKTIQQTSPVKVTMPKSTRTKPMVSIDGMLGDLLKETAQSMYTNPEEQEEWPDMNSGPMTTNNLPSMLGLPSRNAPQATSTNRFDADPTAAFMKDYSAVMKSADEHQGRG